jgi:hypothetical protein
VKICVVVLCAIVAVVAAVAASAARPPTARERAAIMLVFNQPGRSFAAKCVRIRVSTVNPRWAMLTGPRSIPQECIETGQVGDGFVIFKRPSRLSQRWRNVYEGSEFPPCSIPVGVRRDLLGTTRCF